jgi:hypothetical protein
MLLISFWIARKLDPIDENNCIKDIVSFGENESQVRGG